jgi:hypothetical protein
MPLFDGRRKFALKPDLEFEKNIFDLQWIFERFLAKIEYRVEDKFPKDGIVVATLVKSHQAALGNLYRELPLGRGVPELRQNHDFIENLD